MPVEEVDVEKAHEVMEVNFFGTFYGSRSAIKYFKKQKHGTILNIISVRAFTPSPLSSIYSSSKWAVRGFTELLRTVLEPENISVIAVYPGGIQTEFFGKKKPLDYGKYMGSEFVAQKIIQNLKLTKPKKEIIIKK
jgi:short-subunit dehydrogenase